MLRNAAAKAASGIVKPLAKPTVTVVVELTALVQAPEITLTE